jgi:putative (di)nucleoside polyphosphate hydrolase
MPKQQHTGGPSDPDAAIPYRDNAAAVIIDGNGHVLAGRKHATWHLPQGGIAHGETPEEALKRELCEELGTDKFTIISCSPHLRTYDWPWPMRKGGMLYKGQRQKYFLVRYDGTDADLDPDLHGEFAELAWFTPDALLEKAWDVKCPVYKEVFAEFGLR